VLHDHRDAVEVDVGFAEGGDRGRAATFDGADVDEENLVFVVVDDAGEVGAKFDELSVVELTLEDGELEVFAPAEHELVDLAKALGVADVVGDDEGLAGVAHGGSLADAKLRVAGELAEQHATEQACLDFEYTAVADAVVEDGMGDELVHPPFERHDQALARGRSE
jgi:hypothetical protein